MLKQRGTSRVWWYGICTLLLIGAPTVADASTFPATEGYTKDNLTFFIDSTDDESGVRAIEVPDGNQYMFGTKTQGKKEVSLSYVVSENGVYTFEASDVATNRKRVSQTIDNIDKQAPDLSVEGNPKSWTNETVELAFTARDEGSGVNYIILPDGTVHAPGNLFVNSSFHLTIKSLKEEYGWDWTVPSGGRGDDGNLWSPNETDIALFRNREADIDIVADKKLNRVLKATSTGKNSSLNHGAWGINFELTTGGISSVLDYVDQHAGTRDLVMQVWLKSNRNINAALAAGGPVPESGHPYKEVSIGKEWELYTFKIDDFSGQSLGIWQRPGVHYEGTPQKGTEIYIAYPIVVPNPESSNKFELKEWEDGGRSAPSGELLNDDKWKQARVRQKELQAVGNVERLQLQFNDAEYAFNVAFYEEDKKYLNIHEWHYNEGIIDIPIEAVYMHFMAAPHDRNGNGTDQGITLSELGNLNVQLTAISKERDSVQQLSGVFEAPMNGSYTFRSVDLVGNVTQHTEYVTFIDKTSPSHSNIEFGTDEHSSLGENELVPLRPEHYSDTPTIKDSSGPGGGRAWWNSGSSLLNTKNDNHETIWVQDDDFGLVPKFITSNRPMNNRVDGELHIGHYGIAYGTKGMNETFFSVGEMYEFSVWAKLPPGQKERVYIAIDGGGTDRAVSGMVDDEWTYISMRAILTNQNPVPRVYLAGDSIKSGQAFYVAAPQMRRVW